MSALFHPITLLHLCEILKLNHVLLPLQDEFLFNAPVVPIVTNSQMLIWEFVPFTLGYVKLDEMYSMSYLGVMLDSHNQLFVHCMPTGQTSQLIPWKVETTSEDHLLDKEYSTKRNST